jgi:hypothetical protein
MNRTVNFVYANQAILIKKFLKKNKDIPVINYMDIINKLTKSDVFLVEPSNYIVESVIIKDITNMIEKETENFIYVLGDLDDEKISNLIEFISNISKNSYKFKLSIKSDINYINENLEIEFF